VVGFVTHSVRLIARVRRTKIVNADGIPKDVITLQLKNGSERQVLDRVRAHNERLHRCIPGVDDPNGSPFDRIVMMPPSAPPPVVNAASPAYPCPLAAISMQEPPTNSYDSTCRLVPSPPPAGLLPPVVLSARPGHRAADAEFPLTAQSTTYLGANECLWRIAHEPIPCV
jgi:hypothetical protein